MTPIQRELQREVEDLLQFVYLMPVAVVRLGESGEVLMLNPKAVQLLEGLGVDAGSADGTAILDALSPGANAQWLASAGQVGTALEQIEGYGVLMLDTEGAVIEWNPSIGRLFGKPVGQGAGEPLVDWIDLERAADCYGATAS